MEQSRYTGFDRVQSVRQDQNAARDSDLSLPFLACLLLSLYWIKDSETERKSGPLASMQRIYVVHCFSR